MLQPPRVLAPSCLTTLLSFECQPTSHRIGAGPQFTSNLWTALWTLLGAPHHGLPPAGKRHCGEIPQTVESSTQGSTGWMDELPLVLLGLRSAPKEDLGCAPSELVYGTTVRLPGEFFDTSTADCGPAASELLTHLRSTMATLRPKQTSHHRQQSSYVPVEL